MIYVSGGHEKGVGLEGFFRSIPLFQQNQLNDLTLVYPSSDLKEYIDSSYRFKAEIKGDKIIVSNKSIRFSNCKNTAQSSGSDSKQKSPSQSSIDWILDRIQPADILLTLPTTKDQFRDKDIIYKGHTEYFRYKYDQSDLFMCFTGPYFSLVLLSDHIPLSSVDSFFKEREQRFLKNLPDCLEALKKMVPHHLKKIIISSINPHIGENGLLGSSDALTFKICEKLVKQNFNCLGPFANDTILNHLDANQSTLISFYHDHGLSLFKSFHGLLGSHFTIGLPFTRISPDTGTAFDLRNTLALNTTGYSYVLGQALSLHSK